MAGLRYANSSGLKEDPLVRAAYALDVIGKADAIRQRSVSNDQAERQLKMQQQRLFIDAGVAQLAVAEEERKLAAQTSRLAMEQPLREYLSVYDPTDETSRGRLEQLRVESVAKGFSAQEVNEMFKTADQKNLDLANSLARMHQESGIQDWVYRTDEQGRRKIDTEATALRHNQLKTDLEMARSSWAPGSNEDQIFNFLMQQRDGGALKSSTAEIVRNVNRNQLISAEYRSMVETGVFRPSQEFVNKFRTTGSAQPTDQSALPSGQPTYFTPIIYNQAVFDTEPAAIRARNIHAKMQRGETPVFKKTNGAIEYDVDGVAMIENWLPSSENRKTQAEAEEAVAKAQKARFEASEPMQDATLDKARAEADTAQVLLEKERKFSGLPPSARRPASQDAAESPSDFVPVP